VEVSFASSTAATRNGWRGGYAPNTGHEGGRSARRFRAMSGLMHCIMIGHTLDLRAQQKDRLAAAC